MFDREKLEGQKPGPPQATNVIKRALAGLATKDAHWDFSLRSNSNKKKKKNYFFVLVCPNPISMLLAGEGGAQGGRGSGFSGFWRNIYGAQLFGVGMGRRTQIGRNQESQRGGKEQISEGRRELDRMKDGERERRRKEGEEKKGKGRKGGGREHEIKGWDRYRKLDPRPIFFFFF